MDLRSLVIITVCIQCAQGIFIPSATRDFRKKAAAASTETEYSDLLRDLAVIKLKLETMGYGPVYLEGPYDDNGPMAKSLKDSDSPDSSLPSSVTAEDPPSQFNEMAVLELIPVIIEQKRRGNVSPDEETTLKEIFGDLWIVIEEEVSRTMDEEMNPILKALLQSNNDSRLKRALVQHQQQQQEEDEEEEDRQRQYKEEGTGLEVEEKNDIFGNSVDRVRVTRWPKSFVEVNPSQLSPQQRLMRRAAFQIRRWFDFNSSPQMSTRGVRGGLKHNNRLQKIKRNRASNGTKKRGSAARRPSNRRMRKNGHSNNKQRGGNGRLRKRQQNLRPKRHNTEIYVDDNHGYFDYEDFEDHSFDDMMTKPRTMRSSRLIFDEYDSMENDDLDAEEEYAD